MASHKGIKDAGLAALCNHIKETRATVEQLGSAVVQLSSALEELSTELEGIVNEVGAEVENLTTAIIAGTVTAPAE